MKTYMYDSKSEDDTKKIAKLIASKLTKGDLIVLCGELGSGKTKFTEGFLTYFGLENEISSPTFTIVNEYKKNDLNCAKRNKTIQTMQSSIKRRYYAISYRK